MSKLPTVPPEDDEPARPDCNLAAHQRRLIRRHQEMLLVTGLVIALAFVLQVRGDGRVVFSGMPDYPLPPACWANTLWGVKCPGCGLTRSLIHLAHGDWEASWNRHRLGGLMAAVILLQLPYRFGALARGGCSLIGPLVPRLVGYLLIICLVNNWLIDVLRHGGLVAGG